VICNFSFSNLSHSNNNKAFYLDFSVYIRKYILEKKNIFFFLLLGDKKDDRICHSYNIQIINRRKSSVRMKISVFFFTVLITSSTEKMTQNDDDNVQLPDCLFDLFFYCLARNVIIVLLDENDGLLFIIHHY
jgi:hypothetical protein